MSSISLPSHCLRHLERPAVARCRSCGQAYCRECVVEHAQQMVCAECLRREARGPGAATRKYWWARVPWAAGVQWAAALGLLWGWFYGLSVVLRRIPAAIHEGTVWLP